MQLDDGLEISLLPQTGLRGKTWPTTKMCLRYERSSMKMWPVDITKQCKSKHCIAWEHISPNVKKECHLIPVILVSEWQSKAALLWNTREIELYVRNPTSSMGENLREDNAAYYRGEAIHWMRISWSEIAYCRGGIGNKTLLSRRLEYILMGWGGVAFGMECLNSRFLLHFQFQKDYGHMTLKYSESRDFAKREQPRSCFM